MYCCMEIENHAGVFLKSEHLTPMGSRCSRVAPEPEPAPPPQPPASSICSSWGCGTEEHLGTQPCAGIYNIDGARMACRSVVCAAAALGCACLNRRLCVHCWRAQPQFYIDRLALVEVPGARRSAYELIECSDCGTWATRLALERTLA